MPDLGPHAVFIVSAYVGVTLVTLGLVATTVLRARAARRRLKTLEVRQNKDRPA